MQGIARADRLELIAMLQTIRDNIAAPPTPRAPRRRLDRDR
jgi:hypothetical protein